MGDLVDLLDRPVYWMADVDRVLGLSSGTARRWVDGYSRSGVTYQPIVRESHTGVDEVTWGEFVEVRLLASYRSQNIRTKRMREYVSLLRERFNRRYPLAYADPFLSKVGRELVLRAQRDIALEPELMLFEELEGGQLGFYKEPRTGYAVDQFLAAVDWTLSKPQVVSRLRPDLRTKDVLVDPEVRFGAPQVKGVPTAVLAELYRAGDAISEIQDWYDLTSDQVRQALEFEHIDLVAA